MMVYFKNDRSMAFKKTQNALNQLWETRTAMVSKSKKTETVSAIALSKLRKTNVINFVQGTLTAPRQGTILPLFVAVRVGNGCELKSQSEQ